MSNIKSWSTTAASNNSAAPDGWPENQAPSTVNDCAREMMASLRTFYENIEWRDWGHTPVRVTGTQFTISSASDLTSVYAVNRRLKLVDGVPTTLYGVITASSHAASTQTVDVTWDSGSMTGTLASVSLGFDPNNKPESGGLVHLAGTETITGLKKIPDDKFNIIGSADATKIAVFEVDGLTTATTRTITVPDANITLFKAAAQADMQTPTSQLHAVTPAVAHLHPAAPKAVLRLTTLTTTPTVTALYNALGTITPSRTGTGLHRLSWVNTLTDPVAQLTSENTAGATVHTVFANTGLTGAQIDMDSRDLVSTLTDPQSICVTIWGTL